MNETELENALLLRDSGELSPARERELEAELTARPELADRLEEIAVLRQAGRFASSETVPPLDDLVLERIRAAAAPARTPMLPRLLAVAAGLVIAFALLPFLSPTPAPGPRVVDGDPVPVVEDDVIGDDPILTHLEELEAEVAAWREIHLDNPLVLGDENDYAELLLETADRS